jgi:hypothetical protein
MKFGRIGGGSNNPKTPTEFMVPTNTLPLQTVGGAKLVGSPKLTAALE